MRPLPTHSVSGALARIALCALFVCALACQACRPAQQPELLVQVLAIPPSAASLDVRVLLNLSPANEQPRVELPPDHDSYSFVLALPSEAMGTVQVAVGARDPQGCLLALGQEQIDVQTGDRGFGLLIAVLLTARQGMNPSCGSGPAVIDQISPTLVSTAGGDVVTVDGFGFAPGAVVNIDGTAVQTQWISLTEISAITPARPGQLGMVPLAVTNPDGAVEERADLLAYRYGIPGFMVSDIRGPFPAPYSLKALTVADLDGDGQPDLVLCAVGTVYVSLSPWFDSPDFSIAGRYPIDGNPTSVVPADFDGDGRADLAITSWDSLGSYLTILFNQGNGTLVKASPIVLTGPATFFQTRLTAADFNGDGKPDLAMTPDPFGGLSVMLGKGGGIFQTAQHVADNTNPVSIAAGDFNGDGQPDLVVASSGSDKVSLLLGKGDGTFQTAQYVAVGTNPGSVTAGEFNGDGKPDLVTGSLTGNTVSVLVGNGDGTFQAAQTFAAGLPELTVGPASLAAGDFNGDGKLDLAYFDGADLIYPMVWLGNGQGGFSAPIYIPYSPEPRALAVEDVNADHKPDLIVVNAGFNNISILLGEGDGTFQTARYFPGGSFPGVVAVGDVDGDGKPDLAVLNTGNVTLLLNQGGGVFASAINYPVDLNARALVIGDVDGDSKLDLAVANGVDQSVSVLLNQGGGTFAMARNFPVGASSEALIIGDFNRDGRPDLVVLGLSNSVNVLLGKGNGTFQAAQSFPIAAAANSLAAGDFNRDGQLDLAVSDGSVLLGNGDGTFQAAQNVGIGIFPSAMGDFDGDGRLDLVSMITDKAAGMLLGNGDGTFHMQDVPFVSVHHSCLDAGLWAVEDFNGDGKPDLAVVCTDGSETILLNNLK